ncbi:MAG: 30S ribosomal protein S8 [Candidatus Nomurabacteria bacterium GW2011_GWA1_46_11]|uniref:Small ribosomal subunit protein uS8 n=1 Tax=Candidatus Nomurabacteria bacterium GW2011_GWA1_46_11 TaxID=1618732 RepID=A0A0G1NIP9_9BACT|nr:MAG: 30S ribosomal protein S8 [Candidatus Nomurabacteria bacterium GW2011_GWA1_46_11]
MDAISDMIIRIKNAGAAGHDRVSVPYSKLGRSIVEVLKKENFVKSVETESKKGKKMLAIELFMENRVPKIKGVKRISKPSRRIYKKSSDIRAVKNGYGALVLSTSQGIMSGREAKRASLGGEALFTIW